jgi:acyl-coenzyme A thioesterase PaaI-like protein
MNFLTRHLFESDRNYIRSLWDAMHRVPGGKSAFSKLVSRAATYTGTIEPHVQDLRSGYALVSMADTPKVRNHIQCVHAIALANLAELCGNVALAYSMPDDARFIVAGISLEYLKKARGTIRAVSECPVPHTNERKEYEVHVSLRNAGGEEVAKATLRSLIGPKKHAA